MLRFHELRFGTDLWILSAVLGLGASVAQAQSSVTVKVETSRGAMVSDVKVLVRNIKSKEVLEVPETETGKYATERLKKGSYEFFACDDGLNYEPDSLEINLEENESKKFTLVLGETPGKLTVAGIGARTKVCLKHKATGCEASKVTDENGNIRIRGLGDNYEVLQECKKSN